MTLVRWILALPAGFVASLAVGAIASWFVTFSGGAQWYVMLLSGAGSAWAFVAATFRVAPRVTPALKWIVLGIVALFGVTSAIGSLLSDTPIAFITGATMVVLAAAYSRMSPDALTKDVGLDSAAPSRTA